MLDFIINILATPAICVGLLAMVGLILQGKPVEEVVKGTIKTIVGFLVVSAGASYIQTGSLLAFGDLFNYAFNMQGVVPNNEAVVSLALTKFGADSAYIMVAGMILNIVLARFSNLKYIFLTGHHTLYMACMLAVILSLCGLSSWMLWIAGGCLLAFICAFSPWYCAPTMEKIVETDELGFGHFGGLGYWLSAQCGKLFKGKVNESTEDLNFPQRLTFLRDTTVSIGITMVIFFIVVTGVAVAKGLLDVAGDYSTLSALVSGDTKTHWLVWAITRGLDFSGAVYVILSGVRLIVSELVPAFKGIAEKLVPGAVPAIDCPVVFPYAPNAVLIGFLVSFVGGVVGLLVLALVNKAFPVAMILPGVVPHFFCGATAGVFGNAEGGWRGCLLGSFVHGLLITFLPAAVMPVFTNLGFTSATFSDADFSWMALVFGNLSLNVGATVMFVVSVVVFLAPIVLSLVTKKKSA
ncbi:MAG: PTS ascorbate transporter subunit IIC [Erysipelotrichaceae bacterium]|nr:PTS ascorbate transporter subunit IIC [Erysipelotrichaceae bacterium]MDY3830454.1 PTS ascorbate transporter subunit IIC [Erysipelotrichaceae bacterium]MDY5727365.1 PTS ascorbate transporter subunit IIC [Erysipelotrichaceae bacterium]